jgi:hypothetical protein
MDRARSQVRCEVLPEKVTVAAGHSGTVLVRKVLNGLRFDGRVRTVSGIQFLHYTTHMDFDGAFAHTEFIGYDFI